MTREIDRRARLERKIVTRNQARQIEAERDLRAGLLLGQPQKRILVDNWPLRVDSWMLPQESDVQCPTESWMSGRPVENTVVVKPNVVARTLVAATEVLTPVLTGVVVDRLRDTVFPKPVVRVLSEDPLYVGPNYSDMPVIHDARVLPPVRTINNPGPIIDMPAVIRGIQGWIKGLFLTKGRVFAFAHPRDGSVASTGPLVDEPTKAPDGTGPARTATATVTGTPVPSTVEVGSSTTELNSVLPGGCDNFAGLPSSNLVCVASVLDGVWRGAGVAPEGYNLRLTNAMNFVINQGLDGDIFGGMTLLDTAEEINLNDPEVKSELATRIPRTFAGVAISPATGKGHLVEIERNGIREIVLVVSVVAQSRDVRTPRQVIVSDDGKHEARWLKLGIFSGTEFIVVVGPNRELVFINTKCGNFVPEIGDDKATATATATASQTPSEASETPPVTSSATASATASASATATASETAIVTPPTPPETASATASATATVPEHTSTPSETPDDTPTSMPSNTHQMTGTPDDTPTPPSTATRTVTPPPENTVVTPPTPPATPVPTATATAVPPTATEEATAEPTNTHVLTATQGSTPLSTPPHTPTITVVPGYVKPIVGNNDQYVVYRGMRYWGPVRKVR